MDLIVLRPFYLAGNRQEKGARISVADRIGRELLATGKAAEAKPAAPTAPAADVHAPEVKASVQKPARKPMTTKSASALVAGAPSIERKDHVE